MSTESYKNSGDYEGEYDKPVPTTLKAVAPLIAEVFQKQLNEQLRMQAKVFGNFTPEQEQLIAEAKAKREKERQELLDLLATATGTVKAIIELHSPDKYGDECEGCDFSGWEGDKGAWPCRTIDLIAEELRGKD